jgi:hypothetical protein
MAKKEPKHEAQGDAAAAEEKSSKKPEGPAPAGPFQTVLNIVSLVAAVGAIGAAFTQLVQTPLRSRLLFTFIFSLIGSVGLLNWKWRKAVRGRISRSRAFRILAGRILLCAVAGLATWFLLLKILSYRAVRTEVKKADTLSASGATVYRGNFRLLAAALPVNVDAVFSVRDTKTGAISVTPKRESWNGSLTQVNPRRTVVTWRLTDFGDGGTVAFDYQANGEPNWAVNPITGQAEILNETQTDEFAWLLVYEGAAVCIACLALALYRSRSSLRALFRRVREA